MRATTRNLWSESQIRMLLRSHKFLFAILLTTFLSCSNEPRTDDREAGQKSLIRVVKELRDQAGNAPLSDPNRPILVDTGVKRLKAYIADTLMFRFTGWDARVLDNIKTDPNGTEVRITFGMSIDGFNLEETSRYKSIVFKEWLSDAQPPLKERLQALNVGDHVKISGSFVIRDKQINIDPYNEKEFRETKNIFSNPEFRVDITELTVVED